MHQEKVIWIQGEKIVINKSPELNHAGTLMSPLEPNAVIKLMLVT